MLFVEMAGLRVYLCPFCYRMQIIENCVYQERHKGKLHAVGTGYLENVYGKTRKYSMNNNSQMILGVE